ncbi:MAG: penicillin acylase family protein [Gammaproteobacteria bacterium]|nr:penicillin acylase family protein [Gammaproteobacteria bacterium]MDH3371878.1 penicillin acylase family protein [Gammaproteobacteria bacterium]MDH3407793.1 penicillin acylase family protein [Gammaproteobacteria bacterium]MDH3551140.1 penicillin acylase family protein [Gammaproteobacteria bacterium]
MQKHRLGASHALVFLLLSSCATDHAYRAQLYRTEGGIPHIVAPDFASMAYGTGYAAAEDNICLLARHFLRLRARLSQHFGPLDGNLDSDFFYQLMIDEGRYSLDADPEFEVMFRGYAAGYNRYLRDTGVENLPDPGCRGAGWVREITAQDSRNAHLNPFFLAAFKDMVIAAQPPGDGAGAGPAEPLAAGVADRITATYFTKGSNGVAIGRQGAASGKALLFANPHLEWRPDLRLYPMHQIIPGVINLLGANLFDRASVGFGTNGYIAWTNTVSTARRFTFYQLELVPGDPESYLFDGQPRKMRRHQVTVPVKSDGGAVTNQTRVFFKTHFGYLIGSFPWNHDVAFALRLTDEENRAVNGATSQSYQAQTVRELLEVHRRHQYTTVNLIAADLHGEVLYGDLGAVANLSNQQLDACRQASGRALDGSRSDCQWQDSADAVAAGILPPSFAPYLIRDDFVTNSNDSYWLANPSAPIAGIADIYGRIATERTLRTRSGLQMVLQRLAGSDGRPDRGFTLDTLVGVLMSNQSMAGNLIRNDLVTLCTLNPQVMLADGDQVDLTPACRVLAEWDGHASVDSRGAHLFREFMREANALAGPTSWPRVLPASLDYEVSFDPQRPVATPYGLRTDANPNALIALARATQKLDAAAIDLDARLGDIQGVCRNDAFIPLGGGPEIEGVFNKMEFDFAGAAGYPEVTGSSGSWYMATELSDDGPSAKGILSYSVSANPESPHYSDMTRRLSENEFLDLPYTESEVRAAALESRTLVEGVGNCRDDRWRRFASLNFDDEHHCVRYFKDLAAKRLVDFATAR